MRELNCQDLVSPGGAAVRMPMLTSAGKVFAKSSSGTDESGNKSGDGIVTRSCADLYWDFSAAQHPVSQCESGLLSGAAVWQARNSKPGTDSNWQCMDIDSQAKAVSANQMFLKDRTTSIDARKAIYVQSNLLLALSGYSKHAIPRLF